MMHGHTCNLGSGSKWKQNVQKKKVVRKSVEIYSPGDVGLTFERWKGGREGALAPALAPGKVLYAGFTIPDLP